MSKKRNELPSGTLVKLHSDDSIGIIVGIFSGSGKGSIYTIEWLVDHNENSKFWQSHSFEVIG